MKQALLLLVIFCLSVFLCSISQAKENATWIKSTFFRGSDPVTKRRLTPKDVEDLASKLKVNNIRYAYIFAGPYENDGHLPAYAFSQRAKESITILKRVYPELKILPWIGGIQNKTVYLERPDWVKNAIVDTVKLINEMPLDGIHLDLEYVLYPDSKFNHKKLDIKSYGIHWVDFHKKLRIALPKVFLSGVVVSTATGTKPWKHKHSLSEIKEIATVVNQLSFMFYETSLMEMKIYKANLKEQLLQIKDLKIVNPHKSQFLIGIGTFTLEKNLQHYRDIGDENLPYTLKLLKELEHEINQKHPTIDGLAIYCEWMTKENEWVQLRNYLN